jgi:hypothetical protein
MYQALTRRVLYFAGGEPDVPATTVPTSKKAGKKIDSVAAKATGSDISSAKDDTPKRRAKKVVE